MVLAVGRYYPIKQHHFILQCLAHIPENERPELVIIGNDVPDLAYQTVVNILKDNYIEIGRDIFLDLARRDMPSDVIDF